ncbi:MAG TPA: copper chaperone PCu(A)C [Methylophilaceae bacterium]|nr:copper chaperone PCu(A)C [Methylophilaceae bacterium]
MNNVVRLASIVMLGLTAITAYADVTVTDAWVRATRPAQKVGAAYMTLQSPQDTKLVKIDSSAAGAVEIHSMTMNDGVMKMRRLEELPLPAGEQVKLAPGGFHLMLFDLAKPMKDGETVQFTLHFKDSAGNLSTVQTQAPVKAN